jgi:HrpA-like RNA helicase
MSAATNTEALAMYFCDASGVPAPVIDLATRSPHKVTTHFRPIFSADPHRDELLMGDSLVHAPSLFSGTQILRLFGGFGLADRGAGAFDGKLLAKFVWHLHLEKPASAAFLLFLPGRGDIRWVAEELEELRDDHGEEVLDVQILHSGIPAESQLRVTRARPGSTLRKVILATDIVESSVTIPNVDVVVDTCMHKRKKWTAAKGEAELCLQLITKDEALQRHGRTGRLGPGEVYCLVPKRTFDSMQQHATPHMEDANIADILLTLSDSPVVRDPRAFLLHETLTPPSPEQVDDAYSKLVEVGALTLVQGSPVPTMLGRILQKLPLEPELGLLVWSGLRFGALAACETMVGVVQRGLPFLLSGPHFTSAEVRHLVSVRTTCCPNSDLLAGLRAYQAWQTFLKGTDPAPSVRQEAQWCWDHYLSLSRLYEIEEVSAQVRAALAELGLRPALEEAEMAVLRERRLQHRQLQAEDFYASATVSDPGASLHRLVGAFDGPEQTTLRAARWCIGLAFAAHAVSATNHQVIPPFYNVLAVLRSKIAIALLDRATCNLQPGSMCRYLVTVTCYLVGIIR